MSKEEALKALAFAGATCRKIGVALDANKAKTSPTRRKNYI